MPPQDGLGHSSTVSAIHTGVRLFYLPDILRWLSGHFDTPSFDRNEPNASYASVDANKHAGQFIIMTVVMLSCMPAKMYSFLVIDSPN